MFPRFILYIVFSILLIYGVWSFGVGVMDWVFGVGFSVYLVRGLWGGAFWVIFGVGAHFLNIKNKPGKKLCILKWGGANSLFLAKYTAGACPYILSGTD